MLKNFPARFKNSSSENLKGPLQKLFLKNRRISGNFQYTVPSPDTYPYQWLWDSAFHAIILSRFNTEDAKKEIISLISKQFENGLIPHIIYWDTKIKTTFPEINWGKNGTSSITQPPMLAYAIWEIYQKDHDKSFLKKVYPSLYHYYRYLLTDRDPRENHLIGILNPDESGEDNSPRFDLPLGIKPIHTIQESNQKRFALAEQNIKCNFDAPFCMKNFFWVKDVPFNSIMVKNLKILSQIAKILDNPEHSDFFYKKQSHIKNSMKKFMFEDGLYYSTYSEHYKKIKVKTWAIFSPLFAGILSQAEAKGLIKNHFHSKDFKTNFLLPTTSLKEPSFDPNGFWRGPVWIGTNWFVYKGLIEYGFYKEAQAIKQSSLDLISKSGFREYFNPLTGEGLGAHDFTWNGLILDMD